MFRELLESTLAKQRAPQHCSLMEGPNLHAWLRRGKVQLVSQDTARELHAFLITLPHRHQRLDSTRIACTRYAFMPSVPGRAEVSWFLSTPIGSSPLVLMFFAHDEPCLVCKPEFAIRHIHEFEFAGTRRRQLFGAHYAGTGVEVFTERFGEFDGDHTLWAAV